MQRYFITEKINSAEQVTIKGDNFHHITHVMRMKPGGKIILVSTFTNKTYLAEIKEITTESVRLQVVNLIEDCTEIPVSITIASGLPKGDKLDFIVQKGTELGASQFIAYTAERSVVKWDDKKQLKKMIRLEKIAKEAAEQAHRTIVPEVSFQSFAELLQQAQNYDAVVCAYEESAKKDETTNLSKLFHSLHKGNSLLVIIGPEGGMSEAEIKALKQQQIILAGLGPRILRTETAPLYVLAAASFYFELEHK